MKIQDIEVRGIYDVSGMREDADLMIWLHGPTAEGLQHSLLDYRRTIPGSATHLAWSIMALHRPAEFNKGHVPAYMAGKDPKGWLCIYPFNRSYEWYLLPEEERRDMLIEHGMKGRSYPGILSNTVSTFALNDFEWVLALESDELTDLVDLMRDIRYECPSTRPRGDSFLHRSTGGHCGRCRGAGMTRATKYDAILFASFGGPRGPGTSCLSWRT